MRWRAVRTGALSALDPTGSYLRSQRDTAEPADSAADRIDDLINALKQEEGEEKSPDGDLRRVLQIRAKLSNLRLVAVAGSFVSAAASSALAAVALTRGSLWPVIAICAISVAALLAIAVFFLALRCSLPYRLKILYREGSYLHALRTTLAHSQVKQQDTAQLIRRSAHDRNVACLMFMQIILEYAQVSEAQGGRKDPAVNSPSTVGQLMRSVSPAHPIVKILQRIASDVREHSV